MTPLRYILTSSYMEQHEFTYLLLPILSRKLKRTVPSLLPHSSLLAHTIYQTLVFDGSLRDEGFGLENTSGAQEGVKRKQAGHTSSWEGLSEVILGRQDWFAAWLDGEKKCECFELWFSIVIWLMGLM